MLSLRSCEPHVLKDIQSRRPFEYQEVDIKAPEMEKWKTLYEFDIPVVHVEKHDGGETSAGARKLKHRMEVKEVEGVMDEVESG